MSDLQNGKERHLAVLHTERINSPAEAVRADEQRGLCVRARGGRSRDAGDKEWAIMMRFKALTLYLPPTVRDFRLALYRQYEHLAASVEAMSGPRRIIPKGFAP
jgi:hypothetical protein